MAKNAKVSWFYIWPDTDLWGAADYSSEKEAIEAAEEAIRENEYPNDVYYIARVTQKVSLAPKTEKV